MNKTNSMIAVTMGDPGGIGPEVLVKALAKLERKNWPCLIVFGCKKRLLQAAQCCGLEKHSDLWDGVEIVDCDSAGHDFTLGSLTQAGAQLQVNAIQKALTALDDKVAGALVTGPINKQAIAMCGLPHHGHTDWLALHTGSLAVMMLAGEHLRAIPTTIHIPLKDVASALSPELLEQTIEIVHEDLQRWFDLKRPRLAVCGLNPHAGDGGLLGMEEIDWIQSSIRNCEQKGIQVSGPFPGDTVFYFAAHKKQFDAVIAMYHDQALAPLKLLHFEDAINVTLGLPFLRTSVDHGVAYDLAGTSKASSLSMENALLAAVKAVEQI